MPGAYSSKRAFLFDLDGTLIDSAAAHARAFIEALAPKWPRLAEGFEYARFAGQPTREVFLTLGLRDDTELGELVRLKQQSYRASLEQGDVRAFAGAKELLERLQKKGLRLFLVTGASRISTNRVLALTNLEGHFEGITTAEDIFVGKPAPDAYLHTLERYKLEKPDCLVIEDGENGISAALAAGLEAVLINTPLELPGIPNVGDFASFSALVFS